MYRVHCLVQPALRFWERIPQKVKSENTIGVRLAGVDAPECAHFGKEGQPFGEEAKYGLDVTSATMLEQ